VNELMREEILDQPAALRQSLPSLRAQLAELDLPQPRHLFFAGSGDSHAAPLALELAAHLHLDAPAQTLTALEAARYTPFREDRLLAAISVSGEGVRTIEAARAAREAGAWVLAVTAEAMSTLTGVASGALVLPVRARSRETPHTTDFLTTLLAVAT